ncbi:hypothetical protein K438DRAFT_2016858 [Mycena galopus ATCC 62051]|nr:hypothetical protein K438DRAFT_2016858 [Mycena galopus ATCC 62051]
MCPYLIERDFCKICRRWRPEQRWSKLADCNLETCRYSAAHFRRACRSRRALLTGAPIRQRRTLVWGRLVLRLAIQADGGRRFMQAAVLPAASLPEHSH